MKIRTRLAAVTMAGFIPILIGLGLILSVSIASDRQKAVALIEEYTTAIAESIATFFEDGAALATYLARMQSDLDLDLDGRG